MLRLVLSIFLIAALGMPSAQAVASKTPAAKLPTVAMQQLDGTPTTTEQWRGQPLVLNIWATWCPPCRKEMPSLQRLADTLAPDGIAVAALSIDEDANLVREFVLKYGIRFPVGIAASAGDASTALNARALPLTLYVAADGRIIERVLGERDWADERLVREIRTRLAPPVRTPR